MDEFVRAPFVEECDKTFMPPPDSRFALKLLACEDIVVHADEPNLVDVQTFTLKKPLLLPKGCFVGVFQRTFPPRLQYQTVWPRGEPFKYGVFIGLPNGAHPHKVGDVVHRCTKSEECPGLSVSVKHFDDMEALEAARSKVTADNLQIIERQQRARKAAGTKSALAEKAGESGGGPAKGWEQAGAKIVEAYVYDNIMNKEKLVDLDGRVESPRDENTGEEKTAVNESLLDPSNLYSNVENFPYSDLYYGSGDSL